METQTPEQLKAFFEKGLEYLKEKHGAENVLGSWVHYDESSPHMHVFVVPLVKTMKLDKKKNIEIEDIRLNTKHYMNGKVGCSILQTDIYNACGVPFGLDRGIEKSGVKHVAQQVWRENKLKDLILENTEYSILNKTQAKVLKAEYTRLVNSNSEHVQRNKARSDKLKQITQELLNKNSTLETERIELKKVIEARKELMLLIKNPEILEAVKLLNEHPLMTGFLNKCVNNPELLNVLESMYSDSLDFTPPKQVLVNAPPTCGQVVNEWMISDNKQKPSSRDWGFSM
jgi:hypothetical protein